ncbi:uncharacterized protein LOC124197314 [Daphnia pulex]|uniref:uncharacterized protein LOC124197314 n=1 Tax=Daphnia pulex TaxID=6669 RepID=UPI001EE0CDF9|nr:uncharacterized protein LOC124197314 [Daphnia pulex]
MNPQHQSFVETIKSTNFAPSFFKKMRVEIACLLVLVAVSAYASSPVEPKSDKDRFLFVSGSYSFTTFTVLKATTTTTSTYTSTTTCTTSSAALTTCTIGRRRRGLFYDEAGAQGRDRRGLFYNDEEVEGKDGGSFLPAENKSSDPVEEVAKTSADDSSLIPLEIESGYDVPVVGPNRFLLSFGTSTVTSLVLTTSTVSLTAFCSSTSGFSLCGTAGK